MRIIKLKINNFRLPLFFLAWFTVVILPSANAETTPQSEEANSPPAVQNQTTPAEEKPETITKKVIYAEQPKPATKPGVTLNPPENSTKKTEPFTKQSENNKQPDSKKIKPKPDKELDLPEVPDDEIQKNSYSKLEIPEKSNKSIIKITISGLLVGLGLIIIIKVIISNMKIPKNYEPHIKSKHDFKLNKRKSKYNLKYK